jgi:hypothetical protein
MHLYLRLCFKYCALPVSKGGPTPADCGFGGGTLLTQESLGQ